MTYYRKGQCSNSVLSGIDISYYVIYEIGASETKIVMYGNGIINSCGIVALQ